MLSESEASQAAGWRFSSLGASLPLSMTRQRAFFTAMPWEWSPRVSCVAAAKH